MCIKNEGLRRLVLTVQTCKSVQSSYAVHGNPAPSHNDQTCRNRHKQIQLPNFVRDVPRSQSCRDADAINNDKEHGSLFEWHTQSFHAEGRYLQSISTVRPSYSMLLREHAYVVQCIIYVPHLQVHSDTEQREGQFAES